MVDVGHGLRLHLEGLVGLQGNEDAIPYSGVFQNEFGGGQFDDLSFNVINHIIRFFTSFRMTEGFWDHGA